MCRGAVAMTRLGAGTVAVIAGLMLASGAEGEAGGGFEDCVTPRRPRRPATSPRRHAPGSSRMPGSVRQEGRAGRATRPPKLGTPWRAHPAAPAENRSPPAERNARSQPANSPRADTLPGNVRPVAPKKPPQQQQSAAEPNPAALTVKPSRPPQRNARSGRPIRPVRKGSQKARARSRPGSRRSNSRRRPPARPPRERPRAEAGSRLLEAARDKGNGAGRGWEREQAAALVKSSRTIPASPRPNGERGRVRGSSLST